MANCRISNSREAGTTFSIIFGDLRWPRTILEEIPPALPQLRYSNYVGARPYARNQRICLIKIHMSPGETATSYQ